MKKANLLALVHQNRYSLQAHLVQQVNLELEMKKANLLVLVQQNRHRIQAHINLLSNLLDNLCGQNILKTHLVINLDTLCVQNILKPQSKNPQPLLDNLCIQNILKTH